MQAECMLLYDITEGKYKFIRITSLYQEKLILSPYYVTKRHFSDLLQRLF